MNNYPGVTFDSNRWRARISINGRTKHLGYFNTQQAALKAHLAAREGNPIQEVKHTGTRKPDPFTPEKLEAVWEAHCDPEYYTHGSSIRFRSVLGEVASAFGE